MEDKHNTSNFDTKLIHYECDHSDDIMNEDSDVALKQTFFRFIKFSKEKNKIIIALQKDIIQDILQKAEDSENS